MIDETLKQRFFAKVDKEHPSGCWIWTASTAGKGYGQIKIPGTRKQAYAHRLSWEIHNGSVPNGLFILHKCDNPRCVNPEHLFLGTAEDNSQDMKSKNRHLNGEKNHSRKLTEEQVKTIKLLLSSCVTQKTIASVFKISQMEVSRINTGQRWAHVTIDQEV